MLMQGPVHALNIENYLSSFLILFGLSFIISSIEPEACVVEWLTAETPDLEVRGSSLARRVVSLDKELYSTLCLFTCVYKWIPATYCWGVTLRWTSIPSMTRGE